MKESGYVNSANLTRLRIIEEMLRMMIPTKNCTNKDISELTLHVQNLVDGHYPLIDGN